MAGGFVLHSAPCSGAFACVFHDAEALLCPLRPFPRRHLAISTRPHLSLASPALRPAGRFSKAFLASSDGALVSRLRELSTGLLFITSIPGRLTRERSTSTVRFGRAFFMLDWAGRDDDFEAEEFDVLVEAFSLDLALAPGACPATRHRSRRHGRDRQHHPRSTGAMRPILPLAGRAQQQSDINTLHRKEDSRCPRALRSHPGGNRQPPPRGFSRLPPDWQRRI